MDENKHVKIKL